jgi:hypothetical protein
MKRLLLLALAIAAPAYAQDSIDELNAEQRNALQTYFTCLYRQAAATDDGLVDAASLARSFAPNCRPLLDGAVTVFSQGKSSAERNELNKKWLGLEEVQATRTVWALRQDRAHGITRTADTTTLPDPAPAPVQLADANTTARKPAATKPKPAATAAADGKPMSEWRRAYIAKHGREPPVPAN